MAGEQSLNTTIFVTEELLPFNFHSDDEVKGIGVDALLASLKAVGVERKPEDIQFFPWARAYYLARQQPNTCLFVTYRSPQRESQFKWVGPITDFRVAVISSTKTVPTDGFPDLLFRKVGVLRGSFGHQLLLSKGFPTDRIEGSASVGNLLEKLEYGRIDVALTNDKAAQFGMRELEMDWADYRTDFVVREGYVYFAFNPDTPDAVVDELQRGLDIIRKNGTLQHIIDSYLK